MITTLVGNKIFARILIPLVFALPIISLPLNYINKFSFSSRIMSNQRTRILNNYIYNIYYTISLKHCE